MSTSREPLSQQQVEILKGLLEGRILEISIDDFPYMFVLKRPGRKYGVHYASAPIRGLEKRDLIKRAVAGPGDFVLSAEGRQVAAL